MQIRPTTASLAILLALILAPTPAHAQSLGYIFNLPISKVVPNPCGSTFVLVNGTLNVSVGTAVGSDGFTVTIGLATSGKGQDVLADGTLTVLGKPDYSYSGSASLDATYDATPSTATITLPMRDYLVRPNWDRSDIIALTTTLQVTLTNGVPTAPQITALAVRCQ